MSLINDALKRASQAQPPPPPVDTPPPFQAPERKSPMSLLVLVLPLLLLFIVGLAGWFVFKGVQAGAQLGSDQLPVIARETAKEAHPAASTNAPLLSLPEPATASNASKSHAEKVVESSATNVELAAIEPAKLSAPVFRLQGIFYRPARPSALVNAKTVFVGDRVANAKVLAIEREKVTLEYEGQTKVLTLD